jgi:hypothetical protein
MSERFDNNMKGVLFPTFKAGLNERDHKGSCEIGGVEYWISAWNNRSKDQKPYISLRFKAKDGERAKKADEDKATEDYNDEIPF